MKCGRTFCISFLIKLCSSYKTFIPASFFHDLLHNLILKHLIYKQKLRRRRKRKSFIPACCVMEIFVCFHHHHCCCCRSTRLDNGYRKKKSPSSARKIDEMKRCSQWICMNIVIMKWKGFLETITSYDATWKKNSFQLYHEMSFVQQKQKS